jgi:hypothetical protein
MRKSDDRLLNVADVARLTGITSTPERRRHRLDGHELVTANPWLPSRTIATRVSPFALRPAAFAAKAKRFLTNRRPKGMPPDHPTPASVRGNR